MVKDSRVKASVRSPSVGRPSRPAAADESSMDSSVYDISMDDSSSIHSSDYSRSSAEELYSRKDDTTLDDSLLSRLTDEILEAIKRRNQTEWPLQSSTNSTNSSSSSGSPWVDDDSSSCSTASSKTSLSPHNSQIERRQFDEARNRMAAHQVAQQVALGAVAKSRRRDTSPSSIRTGMSPSKPIDVTDHMVAHDHDIPISHRILDQVRHARRVKAAQSKSKSPRGDFVAVLPSVIPAARIVGLVSERSGKEVPGERRDTRVPVKHTAPQLLVPTMIPKRETIYIDNVSSMGGTCGDFRPAYQGRRDNVEIVRDLEHGQRVTNARSPVSSQNGVATSKQTHGWFSRRSDLELCLIGLVVSSLATLAVLVAMMILSQDIHG